MANEETLSRVDLRRQRRVRMEELLAEVRSEEFTREAVAARVPELVGDREPAASEVVRFRQTGRLTIRYVFPKGIVVYGKFYDDGLGPRAFRVLRELWQEGFGTASSYQVAEPLHFDDSWNMLLLRQAEGVQLSRLFDQAPLDEALRHAELAATWLARFHRTAQSGVNTETPAERMKLFKLATTLVKAAAANPRELDLLLDLLHRLRKIAPPADAPLATVHGQFTPANMFVAGTRFTVIDLDRSLYSDPALDVAMFFYRVRHHGSRHGTLERARAITSSFLAQYDGQAARNLINFRFYCAHQALKGLAGFLKEPQEPGEAYERQKEFYLAELEESLAQSNGSPA